MTDFAAEIRAIASRVLAERDSGRGVDPSRVLWAEWVLGAETSPAHARVSGAREAETAGDA